MLTPCTAFYSHPLDSRNSLGGFSNCAFERHRSDSYPLCISWRQQGRTLTSCALGASEASLVWARVHMVVCCHAAFVLHEFVAAHYCCICAAAWHQPPGGVVGCAPLCVLFFAILLFCYLAMFLCVSNRSGGVSRLFSQQFYAL
jgi:hypothetical protein